ncbi:hypothetical protein P3551_22890 [Vibrio parahaemolyticus]|nr:hypothetical protein [Vibrio parahaemolyticus]
MPRDELDEICSHPDCHKMKTDCGGHYCPCGEELVDGFCEDCD